MLVQLRLNKHDRTSMINNIASHAHDPLLITSNFLRGHPGAGTCLSTALECRCGAVSRSGTTPVAGPFPRAGTCLNIALEYRCGTVSRSGTTPAAGPFPGVRQLPLRVRFPGRGHDLARHDLARHDLARHDLARHDLAWHDLARHDLARHDLARHDLARHDLLKCKF